MPITSSINSHEDTHRQSLIKINTTHASTCTKYTMQPDDRSKLSISVFWLVEVMYVSSNYITSGQLKHSMGSFPNCTFIEWNIIVSNWNHALVLKRKYPSLRMDMRPVYPSAYVNHIDFSTLKYWDSECVLNVIAMAHCAGITMMEKTRWIFLFGTLGWIFPLSCWCLNLTCRYFRLRLHSGVGEGGTGTPNFNLKYLCIKTNRRAVILYNLILRKRKKQKKTSDEWMMRHKL